MLPFDPQRPFNSLPLLPPPTEALEHPRVLKTCIEAARNLERLNAIAGEIPGLATWLMPLLEARWSAAIEGIETSVDEVLLAAAQGPSTPSAEQVCRIAKVVKGFSETPHFTTSPRRHAIMINRLVLNAKLGIRQTSGVCLKSINHVVYTPPRGEQVVAGLVSNWEKFLRPVVSVYGLDSLIKMAVQHYQFEAIHPFIDGNGRTGRALNILYAFDRGLIELPVMNLSRWFWHMRVGYYKSLMMVTEKAAWVDWIEYFLMGVDDSALWGISFLSSLQQAISEIEVVVAKMKSCPENSKAALVKFLSGHVYFTQSSLYLAMSHLSTKEVISIASELTGARIVGCAVPGSKTVLHVQPLTFAICDSVKEFGG